MRPWAAALLVAAGCVPSIPSLEGKACDTARPCGEGYDCRPSDCRHRPATAVARVLNGDFEAGEGLIGWRDSGNAVVSAQQSTVHGGAWAARTAVKSATSTSYFGLNSKDSMPKGLANGLYCARAWVHRGTVPVGQPFNFFIRTWNAAGDFMDSHLPVPAAAGWQEVTHSAAVSAPYDDTITVRFSTDSVDGGEYFADDVDLWPDTPVCSAVR